MAHHPANATAGAFIAKTGIPTMPSSFRRPGAPRTKLRAPDWYVSSLMMDRALDAVMRRVKHFDRKHDVPYLAGYSLDGKTIYIDRHMPKSLKVRGRTVMTDRFLVLHEEVEKSLIDQLGLHYMHAHQIATRAEQAAVRAAGISWKVYDRFMQKYVKRDGHEKLTNVPADLDTKPYRDEHDFELLRRMIAATERGAIRSPQSKVALRKTVGKVMREVDTHRRAKLPLPRLEQARRRA
jgi:hypothetical protein